MTLHLVLYLHLVANNNFNLISRTILQSTCWIVTILRGQALNHHAKYVVHLHWNKGKAISEFQKIRSLWVFYQSNQSDLNFLLAFLRMTYLFSWSSSMTFPKFTSLGSKNASVMVKVKQNVKVKVRRKFMMILMH